MPGRLSLVDVTEEELAIVQRESMAKMAGISIKDRFPQEEDRDEGGRARLTRANLDELSQAPGLTSLTLPRLRSAKSRKGFLSERSKKVSHSSSSHLQ